MVYQQNLPTNLITELLGYLLGYFFACLANYPLRFSVCSRLVSKPVQITTVPGKSLIFYYINQMAIETFPPDIAISKSNYIFYGPV